ncbi:hypothetical protein [uncultured Kiloniella sp.]|uniref:hypothetical protein n=1 Tax=uncultured Kiloniella sp. TaxID=1133091 RepID=UPI00262DBC48|nr:hypothetical protein [uncultured Kiloniella sp.]
MVITDRIVREIRVGEGAMFWDETSDNAALVPFLPLRIRLARFWSRLIAYFNDQSKSSVTEGSVKSPD